MNNGAAFDALMTCFQYAYFGCMVPEDREQFLEALSIKLDEYKHNAEVARTTGFGSPPGFPPPLSSAGLEQVREWIDGFKKRVERA